MYPMLSLYYITHDKMLIYIELYGNLQLYHELTDTHVAATGIPSHRVVRITFAASLIGVKYRVPALVTLIQQRIECTVELPQRLHITMCTVKTLLIIKIYHYSNNI
jgi:hypothetical protein